MSDEALPLHSPVGASGAKRFLICPGSVGGQDPDEWHEESEHAALGTAVHTVIERAFVAGTDAWTMVGQRIGDIEVTKKMADGAQVMLDAVRGTHPERTPDTFVVEHRFHCPTIHRLFLGTADCVFIDWATLTVHIWDYKNGAGVVVEVEDNEQEKYYACGVLESMGLWSSINRVVLHIVQPNAFHPDGRVRAWETTPDDLAVWLEDVLVPGMERALTENSFVAGSHCVFCPKRYGNCPALAAAMDELEGLMNQAGPDPKQGVEPLTNAQLGRLLTLSSLAAIVRKAALTTGMRRLNAGASVPGWKLVAGKADRVWKDGAEAAAKEEFGDRAYTQPALKSPAQIEELPLGKAFTTNHAFKPDAGLTMAPEGDKRKEVSRDTKTLFTPVESAKPVVGETPALRPSRRRATGAA